MILSESIILAVFVFSMCGVLIILARKIPALNTLPKNGTIGIKKHHVIENVENKLKAFGLAFEKQIYLHKVLSFIKVTTLKIETKVDHLLHNLRKKAQEVEKKSRKKK